MNNTEHMAKKSYRSRVRLDIAASPERIWRALTNPQDVKQYMMGAELETDWQVGSPVVWRGEYKGKQFEDRGTVLRYDKPEHLAYTHFSPSSGEEDKEEQHREIHIRLSKAGDKTRLILTQDNNLSPEAKEESEANWKVMMKGLRRLAEK
ncbi:MAG: SRPBCC domain-containing protein [Flavobacteriales bacterium]